MSNQNQAWDLNDFSNDPNWTKEKSLEITKPVNAKQKVNEIIEFIADYPDTPMRTLADSFHLDFELEKEFNNGLARIGLYYQNIFVMDFWDKKDDWFR